MQNIRLIIEYDGGKFFGFQDQGRDDQPTIQGALEKALEQTTGESLRVVGAGRTDAGVHALGQVINIKTRTKIPVERLPYALNMRLPRDIVVREAMRVPDDFHARISATSKVYRYSWYNRPFRSPLWDRFVQFVPEKLDVEAMQQAAEYFIGEHDFAAFRSAKSSTKTSVRRIIQTEWSVEMPLIQWTIEGTGFLYNMVRIMAGTILRIGLGKAPPEQARHALLSGRREDAGPTAPPQGLCMVAVKYESAWPLNER